MEDLKAFVEAVGTPVGFTAVLALSVWKFFRWAAPLGEKLVTRHIEFTQKLEDCQEKINESCRSLNAHMGDMSVAIKGLARQVDGLSSEKVR